MTDNRQIGGIGLTGGIATGKSTVSEMLRELGAIILDADDFARKVVEKDRPAWRAILNHFGGKILRPDMEIDRRLLADIVFSDADSRKALERIVHPAVYEAMTEAALAAVHRHPEVPVIHDIPLLYETGAHRRMRRVIVVYAPECLQRRRLMQRNQLSREDADARIRAQMDIEEKRKRADILVDNSGSLADTRERVVEVYRQLVTKER